MDSDWRTELPVKELRMKPGDILLLAAIALAHLAGAAPPTEDAQSTVPPESPEELEVGNSGAIVLLNRTKDAAHHQSWFFPDPTAQSGVVVFEDDAAGTTIGVVMTQPLESNDLESGWRLERRFWQEATWCRNVTSFGWSQDGRYLFVATSDSYGTGFVYQLDVPARQAALFYPRAPDDHPTGHCWASEIEGVDKDTVRFHVRDYCEEDMIFVQKTLPFLTDVKAARAAQTAAPAP